MQIQHNVSLRDYSTMRLGGQAAHLVRASSRQDVYEAVQWATEQKLPVRMIGSGSNIVWRDEGYPGLIIVNDLKRYEDFDEDGTNHYVTAGAGEVWDEVVDRTVRARLTGIEALSSIPGTAGATPIQNVGAYGQEIASVLSSIEAYDRQENTFINIASSDCQFGYRTSRFKGVDRDRFFITAITLHLTKGNPAPPYYTGVQQFFNEQHVTDITPELLRNTVIAIRSKKLPDPATVANNGSFFANPIVPVGVYTQMLDQFGDIPHWAAGTNQVKLSAAWLIEQSGLKGVRDEATGMGTWPSQPLVFVNYAAKSTADLLLFKAKVVTTVANKFNITLEQEPELLP